MKAAYADPPYLGMGKSMYGKYHPDAADCDDPEWHRALIERLSRDYEAWALSLHSVSLRVILPMCPEDCRVMAWVKTFASYKPGVNPAYAWEPVIVRGGRKRLRYDLTIRDWIAEPITLIRSCPGAKPEAFAFWIFDMLNLHPDDDFSDLFPGSGAVTRAWDEFRQRPGLPLAMARSAPAGPSLDFGEPDD